VGRWPGKYVIGLTGNIAMGKSLVRRMLEHLGAYAIDADGLTHQAMAPGAPAYKPTVAMFGQWILDTEKRIDRSKLGAVVFAHPDALATLEKITHPVIGRAIDTLVQRTRHPVIVVEAIKLLEGNLADSVDAIWVVDANEEAQIERLEKRGLSKADAVKRIRVQNPQADKLAKANVVITNNGTPEEAWKQVYAAWQKIDGTEPVKVEPAATPATTPADKQPAQTLSVDKITIVRGKPSNANQIATMLKKHLGKDVDRYDILMKSYMLAVAGTQPVGLVGFVVENLVTRCDEFLIETGAPVPQVADALISAIERASQELQSEVGFIFLPDTNATETIAALKKADYQHKPLEEIKVPAWREAAREARPEGYEIFAKKLRAERVLKPL